MQLQAARKDISKVKGQLEAQTESAKVASAQCKSAQAELKAVRQQLAAQLETHRSAQSEIESMRHQTATQHEACQSSQAELNSVSQSFRIQQEAAEGELASMRAELTAQVELNREQQQQLQLKVTELETQNCQQAEQLSRAQGAAERAVQDQGQLKVGDRDDLSLHAHSRRQTQVEVSTVSCRTMWIQSY